MPVFKAGRFSVVALALLASCPGCEDSSTNPSPIAEEVEVTPADRTFTAVGETEQFEAVVRDDDGNEIDDAEVIWNSSSDLIATVSTTGVVEAVAEGTTMITATSGGVETSVEVIVHVAEEVEIEPGPLLLAAIGAEVQLSAIVLDDEGVEIENAQIEWTSSNTLVATVDADGLVEAVAIGVAMVTAASGNAEATVGVTVQIGN
jgi:uncharacterized protein YjdB